MSNDSSTGGTLLPASSPAPLEGQALNEFVQQWLAGMTGLSGALVRPRWQAEPANIPTAGNAWCAIGIIARPSDTYPFIAHDPTGNGADNLQRHETLECLASFYDLGTGGQADYLAALFRDGTAIAQNREVLTLANFAFIDCGEPRAVPSLLKQRWLYRVDVPFRLRRAIVRSYPVLNVESATASIVSQDQLGDNLTITVTAPPA